MLERLVICAPERDGVVERIAALQGAVEYCDSLRAQAQRCGMDIATYDRRIAR